MTIDTSERLRILDDIKENWDQLISELESYDEEQLQTPNVVGIWSLKDLLGHLETWDRIAIKKLEYAEGGHELPWWQVEDLKFDNIDEFNESDADEKRSRSIEQLWSELHASHDELIERVSRTTALSRDLIAEDTYDHYAGHLEDIQRWKDSQ